MTVAADQYSLCLAEFKTQILTLHSDDTPYFPAVTGRAVGWQVSENENIVLEGSNYFVVLRPGAFTQGGTRILEENQWHVTTILYMRFAEFDGVWPAFRVFRSAFLALKKTARLKNKGIWNQTFIAQGEAGFVLDNKRPAPDNYTDLVAQVFDITIFQKVKVSPFAA